MCIIKTPDKIYQYCKQHAGEANQFEIIADGESTVVLDKVPSIKIVDNDDLYKVRFIFKDDGVSIGYNVLNILYVHVANGSKSSD